MNTVKASTLRPGLLVSLKTSCTGNVSYQRADIEADHLTEEGKKRAKWETERTIEDPEEHEAAVKAQSKAGSLIRGVCTKSAFGLLCPESEADRLDGAIAEARAVAEDFNTRARLTRVAVYVMVGRIAADDVEAVRAINSEVRDLLADMEAGVRNLDVARIRTAADKAKQMGSMLSPDMAARIQVAIDVARSTARKIVKAGEEAAQEVDRSVVKRIAEQRTAFLDLDEAEAPVRLPEADGRAIDLEPETREAQRFIASLGTLDTEGPETADRAGYGVSIPELELE